YADPNALDSVTLAGSEDYGPVSFDVTEAVQAHLASPSENFGFVIREEEGSESAEDGTRQFHSREAATVLKRPSLTLTFADQPPLVSIESVASVVNHGAAGELGLNVNLAAQTLPADSSIVTTESREEGITKLVIDCDANVTLPDPVESLVESIIGASSGDVTASVVSVTAAADEITINLNPLPDEDIYTVTLAGSAIAGDNDFMIRALKGEVDNSGASSQIVNALDLSGVRLSFAADVTVGDNAKYDIVSDGAINALDLSECRVCFAHAAP
ncbi:MAG: DNRLRE domain-containing protein, partial [Gemmatimonadales bacterium]|nr:DNRLRE domain-containing protein [Gemmatimonadales bacterium]